MALAAADEQDLALFLSDEEDDHEQNEDKRELGTPELLETTRSLLEREQLADRTSTTELIQFHRLDPREDVDNENQLKEQISQQLAPLFRKDGHSVEGILEQMRPNANDEVSVEQLISLLLQLPQSHKTVVLVELLGNLREEYAPRDAIRSMWYKILHPALAKRVKSAGNIPIIRSRLLESKRKQAECDLKLLQNRISLLQQEESRAWKKIVQTKDRANEVLGIREANVKKYEAKSQTALERDRQTRVVQKKQHSLKKESVIKKKHAAIQIISKKYQDVEIVKSESKRLKAEKERQQLRDVERAREKREAIRRQEELLKRKKEAEKQQHEQSIALRYMKKVIDEERRIKDHQRRVEEMERHEQELIQRLQGTQLIQQEAFSVLEKALLQQGDARPTTSSQTKLPGVRRAER